jgi:hypothetical protein
MLHGVIELLNRLRFKVGANFADLQAPPSLAASYSMRMPTALPASEQALTVTAAGQMQYQSFPQIAVARTAFTNTNLVSGTLTFTHNIGRQIVSVQVFDNNNNQVIPDEVVLSSTTAAAIQLSNFGTLTGTWNAIAMG